jgi:hypothetical protein
MRGYEIESRLNPVTRVVLNRVLAAGHGAGHLG